MILRDFIFSLIVCISSAINWSNKLPPKPKEFANTEGCYIKEVNSVIPYNDSINALGYCYLIHCTTKQIDYVSCGVTARDQEYCLIIEADLNKPYPECCPQIKCYETDIPWLPKPVNVSGKQPPA